jgi:hypothetical protein
MREFSGFFLYSLVSAATSGVGSTVLNNLRSGEATALLHVAGQQASAMLPVLQFPIILRAHNGSLPHLDSSQMKGTGKAMTGLSSFSYDAPAGSCTSDF